MIGTSKVRKKIMPKEQPKRERIDERGNKPSNFSSLLLCDVGASVIRQPQKPRFFSFLLVLCSKQGKKCTDNFLRPPTTTTPMALHVLARATQPEVNARDKTPPGRAQVRSSSDSGWDSSSSPGGMDAVRPLVYSPPSSASASRLTQARPQKHATSTPPP